MILAALRGRSPQGGREASGVGAGGKACGPRKRQRRRQNAAFSESQRRGMGPKQTWEHLLGEELG